MVKNENIKKHDEFMKSELKKEHDLNKIEVKDNTKIR